MKWNNEKNAPPRGFLTPPSTWRSREWSSVPMPVPEKKWLSPGSGEALFHVVHKVPSGNSPYVKAKHVQLIDKDPGRAISLFWAAINAGDRVDSALKDMAVVMKQMNRSDEAIEAIRSFRHLCPPDSQQSLDNVLIELYKSSGRVEEEIEMLQRKLKQVEGGMALGFGGKRTKIAKSQGKKIKLTVEQERSRILGNLAWAHLQLHNYGLATQYYQKSLLLEPDKNKKCNLAICLLHTNKIEEAKSLILHVRESCRGKQMDDSYARSFLRASQMLAEIETKSDVTTSIDGDDKLVAHQLEHLTPLKNGDLGNFASVLYTQPRSSGRNVTRELQFALARTARNLNGELRESIGEETPPRNSPDLRLQQEAQNYMIQFRVHESWADMADEEDDVTAKHDDDDDDDDENDNCNQVGETRENKELLQMLKDEHYCSPRIPAARRSLSFEGGNWEKRTNRIRVFNDITPLPDSP